MELVRFADRKGKRVDERASDEIFLSRRMLLFKGMFVVGFGGLAAKLGKMQMIDRRQYANQVKGNAQRFEVLNAPRGMIVDRNNNVLAENRISWTVSILPPDIPDDDQKLGYIRDQLTRTLDLKEMLVVRRNGLPLGSENYVLRSLANAIGADPTDLIEQVMIDTSDNLVPVREGLTQADIDRYKPLEKELPGVHVMGQFDFLLELHANDVLPVTVKKDVPKETALMLQSNALYLPGVQVSDQNLIRRYPDGPEFAHILGYVGPITQEEYEAADKKGNNPYIATDVVGRGGLEEALEPYLRGDHGGRWVQTDARGVEIAEIASMRHDPTPGYTAVLTIDRDFQKTVTAALQDGINKAAEGAKKDGNDAQVGSGVAIAINPKNGEILALVSLPAYDNQLFVDGISEAQYQAYLNDPFKPLTNFAISGEFPPGSTIKPLIACGALQEGTLNNNTQYFCAGSIRVPTVTDEKGGNTYVCWWPAGHGAISVEDALAQSCDVFFYNVGAPGQKLAGTDTTLHYFIPGDPSPHNFEGLGIDLIDKYLRNSFGFGQPTGIELAGESSGVVPDAKWLFQSPLHEYWSVGDTINVSIGQGHVSCTPLQLVCAQATIANSGTYYRPRLVKELRDANGGIYRTYTGEKLWSAAVDDAHVQTVRAGMRKTVTEGTAMGKFVLTGNDIAIAGKTGTAEFGQSIDGKYKHSHAWFTAFAPFDDPEIAVVVLIESGGEGATYAVPVADAILAAHFGKTPAPPATPPPTA
jgi:penicillin-binding protein 2